MFIYSMTSFSIVIFAGVECLLRYYCIPLIDATYRKKSVALSFPVYYPIILNASATND